MKVMRVASVEQVEPGSIMERSESGHLQKTLRSSLAEQRKRMELEESLSLDGRQAPA